MKNKRILFIYLMIALVAFGVVTYFISRPQQQQQELIPQQFAQLPEKAKQIAKFHHGPAVKHVAFSPVDSSLIASADINGTIRLWDIDNGKNEIKTLGHPISSAAIGFSPDGKMLVSAKSTLILWDIDTGKKINTLATSFKEFAFSPDGNLLATVDISVKIWDIRNPKQIIELETLPFDKEYKVESQACAVDISPDGKLIAAGYTDGVVNVWNLQTKKLEKTLESSILRMESLKFSPNNSYLYAIGNECINYGAKSYVMWELPSWQQKGTVLRGNVENLVFSQNEKVCISANPHPYTGRGIEFWSVESGVPLTSIQSHASDISLSHDGKLLVGGDHDGFVHVWEFNSQQLELTNPSSDVIRIVYFLPKNKETPPNIVEKLDRSIRNVQEFYADEMERNGIGRKTFTYETDENGKVRVYIIREDDNKSYDLSNGIWLGVADEISDLFWAVGKVIPSGFNEKFLFPTRDARLVKGNIWMDEIEGISHSRIVYTLKSELNHKSVAYVLREAFGVLYFPPKIERNSLKSFIFRVNYKMPWSKKWWKLSKCQAEWLDRSRYFNPNQPYFDKRPEIDLNIKTAEETGSRLFQFTVADEDGVHQVQLFVPSDITDQWRINKFFECQALNGKDKATVVFEISDPDIKAVKLRMIDMHGNISSREFHIKEETSGPEKAP